MKDRKVRMSNFELMKIISMIFIVLWHFIHNTNLLGKTDGFIHFALIVIWFLVIIHVNSFIIAMGYFQSEKNFKFRRFLSLNNSAIFYNIFFLILFLILDIKISTTDTLELLSPIALYKHYWFLSTYLILYCISPFLNIIIKNISKKNFQKLLLVLFVITSILPTLTGQLFYPINSGHSVFTFMLLYYIGAYIKKYPIEENYYLKNISVDLRKLIFLFVFIVIALFNSLLFHYGEELVLLDDPVLKYVGNNILILKLGFDNPLVIIQTIAYFLYFYSLNIKKTWINILSSCTFGIYLIHDNLLVRQRIYSYFYKFSFKYSFFHIMLRLMIFTVSVFVICVIIEFIRMKIFNKFSKTKLASRLREKFLNYVKSLGINLKW